ncbi:MAG TPA: hypothetical protein VGO68_00365 [Pyrinomonadaceae bacterium]|jgi:hypothetical protein|nr:hypothetical protein [Pyrinomonadaceae bacterium]
MNLQASYRRVRGNGGDASNRVAVVFWAVAGGANCSHFGEAGFVGATRRVKVFENAVDLN